VVCVDEKPQIQALQPTAPTLPVRPGHPEAASFDYVRHGTTTLFAALKVATGKVTEACTERHRHQEFLAFLKRVAAAYPRRELHVVVDNLSIHSHPVVRAWLERQEAATVDRGQAEPGALFEPHPPEQPARGLLLGRQRDRLWWDHPRGARPGQRSGQLTLELIGDGWGPHQVDGRAVGRVTRTG
jgi:hypothetical protein